MEIVIVRREHKAWGIDGHLYINRQRVCDTVEHPTRHLPQGEYMIRPSAICRQHLDRSIPQPFRHGDVRGEPLLCRIHVRSARCLARPHNHIGFQGFQDRYGIRRLV